MRVTPASSTFDGSESILITGQVYDESLRPVSDADLALDLIAEDGRSCVPSYAAFPSQIPLIELLTGMDRYD